MLTRTTFCFVQREMLYSNANLFRIFVWLLSLSVKIKWKSYWPKRKGGCTERKLLKKLRAGMSNSNYLAGRKCNKNWQKGRKSALVGQISQKNNDWICLFTCLITCFITLNDAFRLTKWNNWQKIKIINLQHSENSYSGRSKQAKGPHAARGPPVWHACFRGWEIFCNS